MVERDFDQLREPVTILEDIVGGASGDAPVAGLLRKVKVVAARLSVSRLESWVDHELTGYPDDADLPDYRGPLQSEVRGDYSGPFGSGVNFGLVPRSAFPDEIASSALFEIEFRQSVAELESMCGSDGLRAMWSADAIAHANALIQAGAVRIYEGMFLQQAYRPIPQHVVVGVLEAVRNRILDLGLTLEAEYPQAGGRDVPAPPPSTIEQVVNNIYGGNVNLTVGGTGFEQIISQVVPSDPATLLRAAADLGLNTDDLDDLRGAIEQDEASDSDEEQWPAVRHWIARKVGELGTGATASALAQIAFHFAGWTT